MKRRRKKYLPRHARSGMKALKKLASQYGIKNYLNKSPSALKRAIHRHEQRLRGELRPARQIVDSQQAAITAYRERRLRFLFSPSRFVHAGTHEEYILEKDEELKLPLIYGENELVAMPIDPVHFYVYWDFNEEMLSRVQANFPRVPFFLRVYDITEVIFDGSNAHAFWDITCHPLAREWYVDTPVSGRHVCVELGYTLNGRFHALLRSNTIAIPPETVSPVLYDVFDTFVPTTTPMILAPATPISEAVTHQVGHLFFQPYEPPPEPMPVAIYTPVPQAVPQPVKQPHPIRSFPMWQTIPEKEDEWISIPEPEVEMKPIPGILRRFQTAPGEFANGWFVWQLPAGEETVVRWMAQLPGEVGPFFFHETISTPHDRALIVSLGVWPWQWEEYVPLGASDWTIRRFLGASLFSWYRPGASERMGKWRRPVGASERMLRFQPPGGSESLWRFQPPGASENLSWMRPVGASERRLNWSARGWWL